MKVITSYGGPFVGLDGNSVAAWSGIEGKRFIGASSSHPNDYEAGGTLIDGRAHPPCNIAKIDGEIYSAFLISIGYDLTLMQADDTTVYMFQVDYADEDWLDSSLNKDVFDRADFDQKEIVSLSFETGKLHIFDSVNPYEDIGDNCIELNILPGRYVLHTAFYQPDESAMIFLHKLAREP